MGRRPVQRGPALDRVRANITTIRKRRRLTFRQLAAELDRLGHPLPAPALSAVEQGDRRTDADDLTAIAVALDVTPNALLLPPKAAQETFDLTPTITVPTAAAWRWATGDEPLRRPDDNPNHLDLDRVGRFRDENRPQDGPRLDIRKLEQLRPVLSPVYEAVDAAQAAGLDIGEIVDALKLRDTAGRTFGSILDRRSEQ